MGGLILPRVDLKTLPKEEDALDKYGQPLDYTYLTGLYLLVNAVSDSAAFIDGPDCVMGKAEHVFGKHDFNSTILDCVSRYRIFFSGTDVRNTVVSREEAIGKALLKFRDRPDIRAIFFAAMPMCLLTGTDYVKVSREVSSELQKPVVHVPSNSLRAFFLEGYEESLKGLAQSLDLSGGNIDFHKAGIVGHFMDRTEEDHRANLRELKRMTESLGLDLVSVWPDGGPLEGLRRIRDAGWVISLPYAREAARIVAEKTGAHLLELPLPLGLQNSEKWILELGEALKAKEKAFAFVQSEKERVWGRLKSSAEKWIRGKKFMIAADPYALLGIESLICEFGGEVVSRVSVGRIPPRIQNAPEFSSGAPVVERPTEHRGGSAASVSVVERPTAGLLRREWARAREMGVNCVICNGDMRRMVDGEAAVVEFGYPSYFYHALAPHPFLGFSGCLDFTKRIIDSIDKYAGRKTHDSSLVDDNLNTEEIKRIAEAIHLRPEDVSPALPARGPMSFEETSICLKELGEKLGRKAQIETFIEKELGKIIPRLEWAVPFLFLNKKIVFWGEKTAFERLSSIVQELGGQMVGVFIEGEKSSQQIQTEWESLKSRGMDLLISNSNGVALLRPNCAVVEFGEEYIQSYPTVGFAGTMCLVDQMANAILGKLVAPLG
jgi:nitrogenase molybdenum-iron protein alpha/beta subunit